MSPSQEPSSEDARAPKKITVLSRAAQVLTLADGELGPRAGAAQGALGLREQYSVVLQDGVIAWCGPADTLDRAAVDAGAGARDERRAEVEELDCRGKVIMPALVDSHTHVVWGGARKDELERRLAGADYEEIFAAGGGILSSVRQTRALPEDELYNQTHRRLSRMRAAGTTTFEIKSGYGLETETELKQLRVARRLQNEGGFRVRSTCLAAHAIPAEHRGSAEGRARFLALVTDEILPAVAREQLADYCDVFCDRGAFTPEETRVIFQRARALGLRPRVHANEFGHTGGAQVAAELAAASADHLLHLDARERAALRDAGVIATLLPGTSTVLGKPFADGRALVEDGVPVAVATDCNPGSCAFENLALVLALACYGCRLSPAEAVCATTHNAAASLGLARELGRVADGLQADLLVLETDDYRDLVYHAGSPLVHAVYQAGARVA
ncbi:MAG: imidazolonepropionase [Myxococcales bacterium]|nr:imidazolonepropionase [Myxococcales bacterium]MCB9750374.1 imidazolonepropionase [Myxococcales bacterium]